MSNWNNTVKYLLLFQQLSQAQQHLQQSLLQQQQGIVPVRPSRSRQHGGSRRADPGGGCGDGAQSTAGVIALPAGSRGPRSLYLRREEDSFGFTLRHFIVYPPVSITVSLHFLSFDKSKNKNNIKKN